METPTLHSLGQDGEVEHRRLQQLLQLNQILCLLFQNIQPLDKVVDGHPGITYWAVSWVHIWVLHLFLQGENTLTKGSQILGKRTANVATPDADFRLVVRHLQCSLEPYIQQAKNSQPSCSRIPWEEFSFQHWICSLWLWNSSFPRLFASHLCDSVRFFLDSGPKPLPCQWYFRLEVAPSSRGRIKQLLCQLWQRLLILPEKAHSAVHGSKLPVHFLLLCWHLQAENRTVSLTFHGSTEWCVVPWG